MFGKKGARRIYAYVEDYNLSSQHLCKKQEMALKNFHFIVGKEHFHLWLMQMEMYVC